MRRASACPTPAMPTPRHDDDEPATPRHAASREAVLSSHRLPRTDRARARARHRGADAALRAPAQADPAASRGARAHRPAARPAVTIRRSVASGGTPFHLAWRDRRRVRPRLVLLIDVSRSMAPYSFFYLRLARALSAELADVHSFIFHTRHHRGVAGAARPRPVARAGAAAPDRAGLGRRHAHRREPGAVQPRARAAPRALRAPPSSCMSDGYDTGDPRRCRMRWRSCGAAPGASSGSTRCATGPAMRRSARACRPRCRTWTCWRRAPTWRASRAVLPNLIDALRVRTRHGLSSQGQRPVQPHDGGRGAARGRRRLAPGRPAEGAARTGRRAAGDAPAGRAVGRRRRRGRRRARPPCRRDRGRGASSSRSRSCATRRPTTARRRRCASACRRCRRGSTR